MRFIRRLMEIKETQLEMEWDRTQHLMAINRQLITIIKLLKGGVKDANRKIRNTRRSQKSN